MLSLRSVNAWYGRAHVLQGVDIDVATGEVVSLIGRNGAGKTSILRAIMGLMPRCVGQIEFLGVDLQAKKTHDRFRMGLGYVPEERRIVQGLSVAENIELGLIAPTAAKHDRTRVDEVLEMFPRLRERWRQPATTMSGGEQQMLAIARALVSGPKLLMLDEPSEGIMPRLVDEMFELFGKIAADGLTILLVEQNVGRALAISQRAYIVDQGCIVVSETAKNLLANPEARDRYCSV